MKRLWHWWCPGCLRAAGITETPQAPRCICGAVMRFNYIEET